MTNSPPPVQASGGLLVSEGMRLGRLRSAKVQARTENERPVALCAHDLPV